MNDVVNGYDKFGVYQRNGEDFEFNFRTSLNARQKIEFVSNVTNLVVDDNYHAIVKDLMFNFMVIRIFTDVNTSFINDRTCEDKIGAIESLVNGTNIVSIVMKNAETDVIEELLEAVDLNIEYKTGIHRNLLDEALSSLVKTFERMFSSYDADEMMKMGKMLNGVSGELTPAKMLEAYAKSDIYKDNQKKAVEGKSVNSGEVKVVKGGKKSSKKSKQSSSSAI